MMEFLLTSAVLAAIVGGMIFLAVRRGLQMREICEHGVETTGIIVSKRSVTGSKSSSRRWKLAYRYQDSAGASHEHTSVVTIEQYNLHEQGGPITVVYSSKNPSVSAPKYLVDECRKALGKK
jgi:hypothetical protein